MDVPRPDELQALLAEVEPPCVSLYLPTHRFGREAATEDPLRLRALLAEARAALEVLDLPRGATDRLLAPAHALLDDQAFWREQGDGLAILLTDGRLHRFCLPIEVPELAVVGERFHIHPLVELLADHHVLVLALSLHEPRLLAAGRWSVRPVTVPGLPHGIDEALPYDEREESLQYHGVGAGGGGPTPLFHGHGGAKDATAARRRRYLQAIDRVLVPAVRRDHVPLVVAGVGSLVAEFAALTSHPQTLPVALGNPDRLRDVDLQVAAWEATAQLRQRARRAALDRFSALAGTGRTVHAPEAVAAAATQGRVETLLVPPATELPSDEPAAIQLVDEAIRATLRHRGQVHVVPGHAGLDPELPAAIVRY
jgi:hypothetical protein